MRTIGIVKHGDCDSVEYRAWRNMIGRCEWSSHKAFADYGGRGIKVSERWRDDYSLFLLDMGRRPSPDHSLDRWPDVNGNYEPSNCRWATKEQQANNTRSNVFLKFDGRSLTVRQWAREVGMTYNSLRGRLRLGWSVEQALSIPVGSKGFRLMKHQSKREQRV